MSPKMQAPLQECMAAVQRDVEVRENVATCQAGLEGARSRLEAAKHTVHREAREHMEAMAHQHLCTTLVRSQHCLLLTTNTHYPPIPSARNVLSSTIFL